METDQILDALGHGTRRAIIRLLRDHPRAVGELAEALPVTQPAVSQHLRVLREAGLVEAREDGRRRIYQLRPEGLDPLRAYMESFWDAALEAFRRSFDPRGGEGR